jgi:leucyl aminopeptidase
MLITLTSENIISQNTDCLVLGVFENKELPIETEYFNSKNNNIINNIINKGNFIGNINQYFIIYNTENIKIKMILLIGCGKKNELDKSKYIQIYENLHKILINMNISNVLLSLINLPILNKIDIYRNIQFAVQTIYNKNYNFKKKNINKINEIKISIPSESYKEAHTAINNALVISKAVNYCKHLTNLPSNICTPFYLANEAKLIAKLDKQINLQILDENLLKLYKFNSLLSVGQGSKENSYIIHMDYIVNKSKPTIVLVGKGITFDSGGISIKPSEDMHLMKMDMCGAATVLSVFKAVVKLKLPINISVVIAAAENMPDGNSYRPGDIITTLSGKTVEVQNTDAEGRLVLCDALTYCEKLKPLYVIDVATLTGAAIVALGDHICPILGNNMELINKLIFNGKQCNDELWHLPINELYKKQLTSHVADLKNIGGRSAGCITAASFLSYFTEKYNWAHLDIAGVGISDEGATGRIVPLLIEFLLNNTEDK